MLISLGARVLSQFSKRRFRRWAEDPISLQDKVFHQLLDAGRQTQFGQQHGFESIRNHEDFARQVPVGDYESLKPYIDKVRQGASDVLWPGRPLYFCKTSGTTSGAKFIPISKASMPNHIDGARQALLMYVLKTGRTDFLNGKMIFISGSPLLKEEGDVLTGRLSGIVHHHVPSYLNRNKLPSFETNCIDDWEEKLDAIVAETSNQPMSLISGIPPWVEMYFERLLAKTSAPDIARLFPKFSLFVYGGVNFEPYRKKFHQLLGREIPTLETFPASECFIGFQDEWPSKGLCLIPDGGIFYEFIPVEDFGRENAIRVPLSKVETGVNYVMILNTNAGLWGYNLGDTVRFVSTRPYRFEATGRLSHFTSAFGEHVIAEEAEGAMAEAVEKTGCGVNEFTLAPLVDKNDGGPCHQWLVEFRELPGNMDDFVQALDEALQNRNAYYKDLIKGSILRKAMVISLPEGSFREYMKSLGKLGGQNKPPRLSNDRQMADRLLGGLQ